MKNLYFREETLLSSTTDISVRWSGRVGAVSGFALSLMLRDRIREIVRQFQMPREPGVTASVNAKSGKSEGIFRGNSGMFPNLCFPSLNFSESRTIQPLLDQKKLLFH